MLSGEYAVLDGATAIALPTKLGQRMLVRPTRGSDLIWKSYDKDGEIWFNANISLYDFKAVKTNDESKMPLITKMLKNAVRLNSEFLDKWNGFKIENFLEFPLDWGLGSSSSLLSNLSGWADVNPFYLHFKVSNGSGYDVACATADGPIKYINSEDELSYSGVDFSPKFSKQLHVVHLGIKQSSEVAVDKYLKECKGRKNLAKEITVISENFLNCTDIKQFGEVMASHEAVLSKALGAPTLKKRLFNDFNGSVKSLGAWGGDMILAASEMSSEEVQEYFKSKNYPTVIAFDDLVL